MRRPNIMRPVHVHTTLPEDIKAKMDLYLWSDVEQRIPKGAFQRFLMERIAEFFNSQSFDLAPYTGPLPGGTVVRGPTEVIKKLPWILRSPEEEENVQP